MEIVSFFCNIFACCDFYHVWELCYFKRFCFQLNRSRLSFRECTYNLSILESLQKLPKFNYPISYSNPNTLTLFIITMFLITTILPCFWYNEILEKWLNLWFMEFKYIVIIVKTCRVLGYYLYFTWYVIL